MCSYLTLQLEIDGSAKAPGGRWQAVRQATVYFDHPVHAMAEHTLNLDLTGTPSDPSARIALELTAASARELVAAINRALDSAPAEMTV